MRKLFALENDDVLNADDVVLDTIPEEGEVADVQAETVEDVAEVETDAAAVVDGLGATDQLEEIQEVVEAAAEEGGLDTVAAEAVRIAIAAVAARVGAKPTALTGLYAAENFQSASSRKANTAFALEGVGEFLKDLWKRIKAALEGLYAKVAAFWDKHISALGRVKKALDSMKGKISASSGKLKAENYMEVAPSSIAYVFVSKKDITPQVISEYISTHAAVAVEAADVSLSEEAGKVAEQVVEKAAKVAKNTKNGEEVATENAEIDAITAKLTAVFGSNGKTIQLGTEAKPLVGGQYIAYTFKSEDGRLVVDVERQEVEKSDDKVSLTFGSREQLQGILKEATAVIANSMKLKSQFDKRYGAVKTNLQNIGNKITELASAENKEAVAAAREAMRSVQLLNTKIASLEATVSSANVRMAKGVLSYIGLCLKQYK